MSASSAASVRLPRTPLPLLAATAVAAVAYIDPGNYAANVQAGARYGDRLLWVVASASLMAMLLQYLSAKVGIVTGRSLPQLCRERFRPRTVRLLWLQAEAVCAATDLAEFVGTAIALRLLTGMPMPAGAGVAAVLSTALLLLGGDGRRHFSLAVSALLVVVIGALVYQWLRAGVDRTALAGFAPGLAGTGSVLPAVSIVGATVMPHVVYLHSSMAPNALGDRAEPGRDISTLLSAQRRYVSMALGLAGLANLAMLALAAKVLHRPGATGSGIEDAYHALGTTVGASSAFVFAVSLLISGVASAGVGTYAGQVVMQGFLRRSAPLALRRAVTVVPALALLACGADPNSVLVLSQVLLSMGIPFALGPLVLFTRDAELMGEHANRASTDQLALGLTALLVGLNVVLLATL